MTSPEVERAVFRYVCAHRERKVGREALESSIPDLQSGALPSKLPAQVFRSGRPLRSAGANEKGLASRVTPGLMALQRVRPSVKVAYFYRWRARIPAVHSPVGQMIYRTRTPRAISVGLVSNES